LIGCLLTSQQSSKAQNASEPVDFRPITIT